MISVNICVVILLFFVSAENSSAQIRIKAVGDVMLGSVTPKQVLPPDNGTIFSDSMSHYLSEADIVFGNLEGSFINDGMKAEKCSEESRIKGICYEFGMPLSLAPVLNRMGFTVMSLDNNHSEDYGRDGYELTNRLLSEMGIMPAGKQSYAVLNVKHKKIAVAAFGYSSNSYNISDLEPAASVIRELKRDYDIVIVSFHGGGEGRNFQRVTDEIEYFLGENRGNVTAFAKTVIDAGADMVIGHGPHVLRGIDLYKNKLIAYSLGNFLTYGNVNINGVSGRTVILDVTIDIETGDFIKGRLIPVVQLGKGYPVYDNSFAAVEDIQRLIKLDFSTSEIVVHDKGYLFSSSNLGANPLPLTKLEKLKIPYEIISCVAVPSAVQSDLK